MAFDKQHIDELKKEIILVKKLGDKVGYLVLLNMVSAIFKVKDNTENHNVLKNSLTEIIKDIENKDEDYYKLVQETLKQNSITEEQGNEIPTLDYWMLNIITESLQNEYNKRSKDSNTTKILESVAKEKGFDAAKEAKEEIDSNRFHSLGQVACTMKRIEEIKEAITLSVTV